MNFVSISQNYVTQSFSINCIFVTNAQRTEKMKFTSMVKPSLLLMFTALSLASCDQILKIDKSKNNIADEKAIRIRISNNKEEARLLVKAYKNNLDILELCETIKEAETENPYKQLAENLEETHSKISKNYYNLAREELILIPLYHYSNVNSLEKIVLENDAFIEFSLKQILNKINKQVKLMDTLAETTDNVEFKVLTVKDNYMLKSNINKIENTLDELGVSI